MKRPLLVLVSGGIVLAVVVASLVLQPRDKVAGLQTPPLDTTAPRSDVERSTSDNRAAPVAPIAAREMKESAESGSVKPPVFHKPDARPGVYKKIESPDYSVYMLLVGAGALSAGEPIGADPLARTRVSDHIKRKYDLNDEELAALVDYSTFAIRSDRENQAQELKNICDARATYRSLSEFGNALNAFDNKIVAHQELLGRRARTNLPPLVYQKLNQQVLSRPPKERQVTDFSVLLVTDSRELGQEIARFCDPQPEILAD